jgi:hypothetical protein
MKFKIDQALQILERTPAVIAELLQGLDNDWVMQNEGGDTWSCYDIVGHYIHGEKTDWIPRMEIILGNNADKHFVPFDRFAQFTESKGKSLDQLLEEFAALRMKNIEILKSTPLTESLLDKTGIHPTFGPVTLRELLSAWVAHDLTHIYQASRVLAKQYKEAVGPWTEFIGVLK